MSELDVVRIMREVRWRASQRQSLRDKYFGAAAGQLLLLRHDGESASLRALRSQARARQDQVSALRDYAIHRLRVPFEQYAAIADSCAANDPFPLEESHHAPGVAAKTRRVLRRIRRRLSSQPDRLAHHIVERLALLTTNIDFANLLDHQGELNNALLWMLESLCDKLDRWEGTIGGWGELVSSQLVQLLQDEYVALKDLELLLDARDRELRREAADEARWTHTQIETVNKALDQEARWTHAQIEAVNKGLAENYLLRADGLELRARIEAVDQALRDRYLTGGQTAELIDARVASIQRNLHDQYQRLFAPTDLGALREPAGMGATAIDFFAFEAQTRGSEEAVSEKQRWYLQYFKDAANVLDAGCGRGEFLELCRANGIDAYGVDSDQRMAHHCLGRGLRVYHQGIFEHLASLPDESLGGLFAGQVIEHLSVAQQVEFTRLAFRKLRPGARIVLETVNPSCLTVFSGAFYADPTHVKPVHHVALRFFLEAAGFGGCEVHFVSPIPPEQKLETLPDDASLPAAMRQALAVMNANVAKLNSVLYTHADYAMVAERPRPDRTE